MKITAVETTALAVPLAQDYHWRSGADRYAKLVLFTVRTDEGLKGYGEAAFDVPEAIEGAAGRLAEFFVGRSPGEVERLLFDVWSHGRWRASPRLTNHVLAGIEVACWDVWAKALDVPASAFFGGVVHDAIDFFGFVQGGDAGELARHAGQLKDQGYSILYVKVGRESFDDDIACVAAVRDAVGRGTRLRIDANEAWDVPTAIDRIRVLEEFDLDWVEQPVPGENVSGLAQVRRAVSTKVAADNAVYSLAELRAVLEREAADAVVVSQHESGGLWRLRKMASFAEAYSIPLNRKGYLESAISTFASLQVAATIPSLTAGNQLTHHLLAESLTSTPLVATGSSIQVPARPGLGFELDWDAVERAHSRYGELAKLERAGVTGA